ncbi:SelB C-terminal domain-containing protein [Candidatus Obscuribacterales bacterium]|nr:SelB C-terminal domain-containing protein [Candidatus Obscuribacterales bacterium]MBX3150623.1 SelB C-terminal domain-containing protein [Candidatus Obscuribacterales bacterium]
MSTETTTTPRATLHFTLATAGHVDHGKTSVLRALTGTDPDRLKEEKEREMTIDLGFAHMRATRGEIETADKALGVRFEARFTEGEDIDEAELIIGFVDVPGHGKFLKNMLAGVGGMDLALLVVAADEGVMPQTIQHVKILTLLGVRECILVMNKTDLADSDQRELATEEAHQLLQRLGIHVLETVPFSCSNNDSTQLLKNAIIRHVLSLPSRDRRHDATGKVLPSFLSIDRVFSKAGYGAVVTGTLTRGIIRVGDEVQIEPGSISARVRGLQTFSHKLDKAFPGQRLAINLSLKENKPIERGQAVIGDKTSPVNTLIVQLTDLGGLESSKDLPGVQLKPQNVRFYHGTAERYAVLRWLQKLDVDDEDKLRQALIGQLVLTEPLIAGPGEKFVLRYGDYGIAGGEILMTARPRWLSRAMLRPLAEKIWSGDLESSALDFINMAPQRSLAQDVMNSLLPDFERRRVLKQLTEKGFIEKLGEQLITRDEKQELIGKVLEFLKSAADDNPRDPAVSQEKLKVEIAPLVDRLVFQNIVKELLASNQVVKVEEKLGLPNGRDADAKVDDELSPVSARILEILNDNFCLEIAELAAQSGFKQQDVMDSLSRLEKEGKAAVVAHEFASSSASILEAHRALALIWGKQRNISPGDFREQLGVSRKYAMALLAYFDDSKVTRRLPTGRVLMKAPPLSPPQ